MRSILRQIVAVLALVGIVSTIVPSTFAETYTAQAAADKLAASNFIVDQSATPAAYRLADNLLRQEAVGTAANVLGLLDTPLEQYVCQNKFNDVSATSGWVCRAAELAADAGLTNANNTNFRPKDNLTRFEALVFALRAGGLVPSGNHTQSDLIELGADAGLISSSAGFNSNAAATRGEFFQYVVRGLDSAESPELCEILGICPDDNNNGGGQTTGGAVTVSLSASNPLGYTVPKEASGLHVASYKVYANADTSLSSVTLKRMGLSDDDDVNDFTVLVNGARASDPKDENSDDEVTLTLKNGGVFIKKGEFITLDVLLNVGDDGVVAPFATAGAEFAVSLIAMTAGGTVSGLPVIGNVFKVGTSTASTIEIYDDGTVSDPKLGQMGADLFRFKVKNPNSNDTISLHSITFEQVGGANTATELANFVLKQGSNVLASTAKSSGDYVTFTLTTPLSITEGNNVSLKVAADVVGGAGEDVQFTIDNELDVRASSTRYGNAIGVTIDTDFDPNTLGNQTDFVAVDIDAGVISLIKTDATVTKVREDKDAVVLGSLDIVAGQNGLEVKEIGFTITSNGQDVDELIEDVQIRNVTTGARYDLTASASSSAMTFSDTSFDYSLMNGSNKFEVIADTVADPTSVNAFNLDTLTLSMDATTQLLIEETSDDQEVTDITPSSLSWKKIDGSEAGATFSVLPLADIAKVRGASDVVAMQFEVEADESSSVIIDEISAYVDSLGAPYIPAVAPATNQMVTQVALYKGASVNPDALLDTVSGSQLAAGVANFESFVGGDVTIAADQKQTFTITLSFVDGSNTTLNDPYTVSINAAADISAKDDENDDITVGGTFPGTSARNITVNDFGTLAITEDGNNDENKDPKTILAGTSAKVFSVDVQATNESVDVEEVIFTLDTNVSGAVKTASLYLGDTLIATSTASDISTTITFSNLTSLIIPQESKELSLQLNTDTIGFEKVGSVKTAVNVTAVALNDGTGVSSNADVADVSDVALTTSEDFAIVPVKVTASATSVLSNSSSQAKLTVTVDKGANTLDASNSTPVALLTDLIFTELGNNAEATAYKIYKEGNAAAFGTINGTTGAFTQGLIPAADLTITTSATYIIVPTGTVDKTYSLVLGKSGVEYDVTGIAGATGLTSNAVTDLELGSRTY